VIRRDPRPKVCGAAAAQGRTPPDSSRGGVSYDVLVIGAGPAGSLTAALFARQGRRVLLVDAARFPRSKPCAELVSPGAVEILRRTGVLGSLTSGRQLRGMRLRSHAGTRHTLTYGRQGDCHALAVGRFELDHVLLQFARASGAEVRERFRITGLLRDARRVVGAIGPHGEHIRADLTVGADGLRSIVARELRLTRARRWPARLGLTAHFSGVSWPEDTGEMLVSQHGYCGVAPLDADGRVSVGLVRPLPGGPLGPSSQALVDAMESTYPDLLARLSGGHLDGHVTGAGSLASRVRRVSGPGYALVGDAAGFFDPFTGEGIFRALRGAELLAERPSAYSARRRAVFGAKERLVYVVQSVLQMPAVFDFALRRMNERPAVAVELGGMLGDVVDPSLSIVWRLLGT
jgi:flavin-dependent dehydrogenase